MRGERWLKRGGEVGAVSEELPEVRDRGSIAPRGTRRSPEPPAGVAVGAAARDKTGLKRAGEENHEYSKNIRN